MKNLDSDGPASSRWVAPGALAIAVIAVAIAAWALLRSTEQPTFATDVSTVNVAHSDASKERVCGAFEMVRKAVTAQTNADVGSDPVAREAVAANARLATLGGGDYLLSRLDPVTQTELAEAVRTFANNLQDIGMNQLVGVPNTDPAVLAQLQDAQASSDRIAGLCK